MCVDGWSIKTRKAKKMDMPAWYGEGEPQIPYASQLYINAFWELSTERCFGYVIGPIPWSKILMYASWRGLDPVMTRVFVRVLRELDEEYQDYQKKNQKQQSRSE